MIHKVKIIRMQKGDWNSVSKFFKEGIDTGLASLELEVPTWDLERESYSKWSLNCYYRKYCCWLGCTLVSFEKKSL